MTFYDFKMKIKKNSYKLLFYIISRLTDDLA